MATHYVNFCDKSFYRSGYSQDTDLSEVRYDVLDFLIYQEGYSEVRVKMHNTHLTCLRSGMMIDQDGSLEVRRGEGSCLGQKCLIYVQLMFNLCHHCTQESNMRIQIPMSASHWSFL